MGLMPARLMPVLAAAAGCTSQQSIHLRLPNVIFTCCRQICAWQSCETKTAAGQPFRSTRTRGPSWLGILLDLARWHSATSECFSVAIAPRSQRTPFAPPSPFCQLLCLNAHTQADKQRLFQPFKESAAVVSALHCCRANFVRCCQHLQ